ncbi:MAG: 4-hydroxybutyrate--acetyl-CoA CoA transferase [Clostridia bacterium]|nr:4-hydroxybutyrate--acetyl-CoA CoA transferase [Clostridia bacterium]
MSYREQYLKKFTTVEGVLDSLKDGDYIFCGSASCEPLTFFNHFHTLHGKRHNITLHFNQLTSNAPMFDEKYRDLYNIESAFFSKNYKRLNEEGMVSLMPAHLHNTGRDTIFRMKLNGQHMNVALFTVSPMDKHGYFTTGSTAGYYREFIDFADRVIVEVNESSPRTFGDTYLHISEVDMIYESDDHKIAYLPRVQPTETDRLIGKAIAEIVNDGDTLQLGIGGIPSACVSELMHKRDLGIHTEMLNDGFVDLIKAGAVTNRKKNYFPNVIVTAFTQGCKETYDFIDNNPGVLHLSSTFTNSPWVVARNDNFVAINAALMVDLMGQTASDAVGKSQISGVGGQNDMVVGAKESKGGRSVIALHSTRKLKKPDGTTEMISTITPTLPYGTPVTLSRNDNDFVCTEYGMAALRGASLKERAMSLINIAHPDFRDMLLEEAKRWYLI